MPTAVEATIQAIAIVVQTVPIGTNLGLTHLLWAMVNGSFLKSRGGIHPALKYSGFSDDEIRHSWSAMGYGAWEIDELLSSWQVYVKSQNEWQENRYGGYRVISIDLTGFWRPKLQGWVGKHYHSLCGKALPAVVFGVIVTAGQIREKRVPLLNAIVRCEAEQSESVFWTELLEQVARDQQPGDAHAIDAGVKLREIHAAGLKAYVLRMQANCTARRNKLRAYKGRGAPPKYGELIRPAARKRKGKLLAASQPDATAEFIFDGETIKVSFWKELVLPGTEPSADAKTSDIYVFVDPRYKKPLILATDLKLDPESIFCIYRDRWTVEQPPLAAKQMIGLHRQFVFAPETCFRLPELALLAGSILSYTAAVLPPIPTGFWDRKPQATPGRLRRLLGQAVFPNLVELHPQLRKKNSVTDHLPKGVDAHRRERAAA